MKAEIECLVKTTSISTQVTMYLIRIKQSQKVTIKLDFTAELTHLVVRLWIAQMWILLSTTW